AVMPKGKGARPGGMVRFALGLGVLSNQVLHAKVADLTGSLEGSPKDGLERTLARVWLAGTLPSADVLAAELKPALALEEHTHADQPRIKHLNAGRREAHGDAPGTETRWRWLRGLCAEVEPRVERRAPPPSLGVRDEEARAKHGEALCAAIEDV